MVSFKEKFMKILHYLLPGIMFFSLSFSSAKEVRADDYLAPHGADDYLAPNGADDFLAPKSSFYDSEWINPRGVDSFAALSLGAEGISKLIEMFNSKIGKTLFHDALARRSIRVEFSNFRSPTGAHYLIADIYPASPELQKTFSDIMYTKLYSRRLGDVTDLKEDSLGRVLLLIGKQGNASVPLIWEIQPSTTSRLWQADNKNLNAEELQWRKHVTRALSRFLSIMGFKDIYARSAKSIEQHPKYSKTGMDITENQGVKQWIDPRDVALNYEQTFSNRGLWEDASYVDYELWSDNDHSYNEKHYQLHRYSKPDVLLNEKGIQFYHLFERKTKQGYKMCLGFKNLSTREIFLFDLEEVLKGVKNPLPAENSSTESITKALRFKYKIRLFEHLRPDLELKNALKNACPKSA